jgi:ribosomal protein S18 acetylase RimI-like enzyme
MNTSIATLADIDALITLLGFLFEQEAEFSPDTELQHMGLRSIIENPQSGEILVLRDKNDIIGMVNLLYTISTAMGGKVALLEDMVIHPAHRNRGAGTHLLDNAMQHARQRGCVRITLLTDEDNHDAQRFYRRQGFEPSSMKVFRHK